ncbi:MAG TPA: glutathione S-transferase family protein [Pseudolabrys sp.]|nr:glutathione S-transferase family protein [Pseudolabrys sp.]
MSEIVVHGVPGSPFLRAVEMSLREKDAAYRLKVMGPGDSKSESYLQKNPFGRVPTLEHGDFCLYETQAILRYLDDIFPEPVFEPSDARVAARMNQIIGINDWYFFPKVAAVIVFQRIIGPAFRGSTPDEAAIAAALPMGKTCIAELDRLLGKQQFLTGEQLTIADLILAPQLDFFAVTPEGQALIKGTQLEAWLARMNARPSMQATQRPEGLRRAA